MSQFDCCRNDKLINLKFGDVRHMQKADQPYLEFTLVFHKTNKDPTKGK